MFAGAATISALILVLKHFIGAAFPGCGPGSACDEAARSVWGRVPGIGWPVSFLGAAYFAAVAAAWTQRRGTIDRQLRIVIRIGAAVSVGYLVVIVVGRHFCPYCIGAHVGNLAFWMVAESSAMRNMAAKQRWALPVVIFLVASAGLGIGESVRSQAAEAKSQREAAESTQRIIAVTSQKAIQFQPASSPASSTAPQSQSTTKPALPSISTQATPAATQTAPARKGFTGRWRLGPEPAPIRIVVCSDYQCPACRNVEKELRQLHKSRSDVSISMKQYPVCTDCNRYMTTTVHANACWAARCAETAGILRGNDAFWEMHFALFDRGGSFTDAQLVDLLKQLKYEPGEFQRMMMSDEPLQRVKQDIDDAMAVGMRSTPMVMINGVEFRGWETPGAIGRAVAQLAATNPPALGAGADQPLPTIEKLVEEWRQEPQRELPVGSGAWWSGPADAKIEIVMFADYQEPTVALADAAIRADMQKRGNIRYAVAQYPFNQECNPTVTSTGHAQGCWASKAAIAAGRLGGADGYWKMHDWLLKNQSNLNDSALLTAAPQLGFEGIPLLAELQKPEVAARIASECNVAKKLGLTAIPTIYVNRKPVQMWDYWGENVLTHILEAAAQ